MSAAPKYNPTELAGNFARAADLGQKILSAMANRQVGASPPSLDPFNMTGAITEFYTQAMKNPGEVWQQQLSLWEQYAKLWQNTAERSMDEKIAPMVPMDHRDKRFKDPAWQESVFFDFLRQNYLLFSRWLMKSVVETEGLDPKSKLKLEFFARQFADAIAPSNFAMTNPEVIKTTLESNGESLVKGLQNMLKDVEQGQISMTDYDAFQVGKNLATTPGKIIFQNDLMQLIQYAPTTEKVHKVPVLIMSAWINKYYIMDLKPENSFIKWMIDQGYTVFVISWVNPDEKLGRKNFSDYLFEGPVAAMDAIEQATGEKNVNIVGYCLGGTLLSVTLAYLTAKGKADRVKSATYLTTMVDFSDAGDMAVFIDDEQLKTMESRMSEKGYLEGKEMATTFNMLRSNDLIWSFVVNNYLLGKEPFPFDLLYWNSDATRMPAVMHSFYLRHMYQRNELCQKGKLKIDGVAIDLSKIETPTYLLSTREDHIAPWKSTYAATQIYSGPVTFTLAASGHIAGVVNPPDKKKYGFWSSTKLPKSAEDWLMHTEEKAGSWWPHWEKWLGKHSGDQAAARKPGAGKLKVIEDAPGSYVKVKS